MLFSSRNLFSNDILLAIIRIFVGGFLVFGVADNILEPARMREFDEFLSGFGFAPPEFWARVTVYAQLAAGVLLVIGLLTRVAAVTVIVNFVVAILFVDHHGGVRASYPSASLIILALTLIQWGGGRYSVDHITQRVWTRRSSIVSDE